MTEFFIYRENPAGRKIIGYASVDAGEFPSESIPFVTRDEDKQGFLDLSTVRRGKRGSKIVGVTIDWLRKEILVGRRTGQGWQRVGTDERIGIQVLPLRGLSR